MNYYHHHRSNSLLLQSNVIIRNNTLSPNHFEKYIKSKREQSIKLSFSNIDNSNTQPLKETNDYPESLKNKIFSPIEDDNDSTKDLNQPPTDDNTPQRPQSLSSKSLSYSPPKTKRRKILVLDLDETLVHSSFNRFSTKADIELFLKFDGLHHKIYVLKRPYVNEFLKRMNELFDLYIFTASIPEYANPLLDRLDTIHVIKDRLYRGDCIERSNSFVKDLSVFRRNLSDVIILDNNPVSYSMNQLNGIPIQTWHDDKSDDELLKLIPLMEFLANVKDVRLVIERIVFRHQVDHSVVDDIIQHRNENRIRAYDSHHNHGYTNNNNDNSDYIKIIKADSVYQRENNKQDIIKVKQKHVYRFCCLESNTNPHRNEIKTDLQFNDNQSNKKANKANHTNIGTNTYIKEIKAQDEPEVKFISLNQYILARNAAYNAKDELSKTREETKTRTNMLSQSVSFRPVDLLSEYNQLNRSSSSMILSSFKHRKANNLLNLLSIEQNIDNKEHNDNNVQRKIKSFIKENSGYIYKKKLIGHSLTTPCNTGLRERNKDTTPAVMTKPMFFTPQKRTYTSNVSRYNEYRNKSFDFEKGTKNDTALTSSMQKRLMLIKLKEEHKLAPINSFDRKVDIDKQSLILNIKVNKNKKAIMNSTVVSLHSNNSPSGYNTKKITHIGTRSKYTRKSSMT